MLVRLNKYLSENGIASRRNADKLIEEGEVKVNGKTVYEMGTKIDASKDAVVVKGKKIQVMEQKFYVAFHKPKNVLTTLTDPEGRPCVGEYFNKYPVRLFPVGRLDWESEGLLIMTNDGEFANKISHPKNKIPKTYLAKLDGKIHKGQLQKLRNGVSIEGGGRVSAKEIKHLSTKSTGKHDWISITIMEGKNRQIRKMFEKVGFSVLKLQRVAIGNLELGKIPRGDFKPLTAKDMEKIFTAYDEIKEKKISKREIRPMKKSQRMSEDRKSLNKFVKKD